jgi:hypothetical protein
LKLKLKAGGEQKTFYQDLGLYKMHIAGLNEGVREKERRSMEERLRDQEGDIRRRMDEIRFQSIIIK